MRRSAGDGREETYDGAGAPRLAVGGRERGEGGSGFFAAQRAQPSQRTIEVFGERYVLVPAASLSVEFFALVRELYGGGQEHEADRFALNLCSSISPMLSANPTRKASTRR